MEINIDNRSVQADIISRKDNKLEIKIDDKIYNLDIVRVEEGVYSIIKDGKSINIELVNEKDHRNYTVNTSQNSYKVEIVDAQSKYKKSRLGSDGLDESKNISSPMPGKVVKILVNEGDPVEPGQTLIIVSAMKMESEYKSGISGFVGEVNVNEGDTVQSNQIMIKLSD